MNTINIFLSCTSEIINEIDHLEHAANVINTTRRDLQVNILSFRKNSHPSSGAHAQELIYNQIGNKYHIYLGIFWRKFGSPTEKYDSGVVDEYEKALQLGKKIMFYFNNQPPVSMSDINIDDYIKIQNFKKKLEKDNILYHQYNGSDAFDSCIIKHLIQQIDEIIDSNEKSNVENEVFDLPYEGLEYDFDPEYNFELDFTDFLESFENVLFNLSDLLKSTIANHKEFIDKIDIKYEQVKNSVHTFKINQIYKSISEDTRLFCDRLNLNVMALNNNAESIIVEMNNAFLLFPSHDLNNDEKKELVNLSIPLNQVVISYNDMADEINYLRKTISMSSKLSHHLRKQNRVVMKKLVELEIHIANYGLNFKEFEKEYLSKIVEFL
jgi:hypothetical protein